MYNYIMLELLYSTTLGWQSWKAQTIPSSAGGGGRAQETSTSSSRSEPASRIDEEGGGGEEGVTVSWTTGMWSGTGRWSGTSDGGIMTGDIGAGESPDGVGEDPAAAGASSAAEVTKPTWRNRGSTPPDEDRGGARRMSIAEERHGREGSGGVVHGSGGDATTTAGRASGLGPNYAKTNNFRPI
jgi:hypothetical protein